MAEGILACNYGATGSLQLHPPLVAVSTRRQAYRGLQMLALRKSPTRGVNRAVKSRMILVKMGAEEDSVRGIVHVCGWAWRQTVTALRWGSQPWCSELDTCLPKMEQLVGEVHWPTMKRRGVLFIFSSLLLTGALASSALQPTYALTEENLLFLEAWRTVDRAYVDKSFNGQSWFRYREDALRKEPMRTREQT